ncbi:MAG: hypothetical protein RLZZ612_117 [Pseudomonadota bacterium]
MLSEFLLAQMSRLAQPGHTRLAALPLNRQLVEALRRAMLEGILSAGERLPSSRDLAHDLGLSRNTVMAAIGQLSVEGYLNSQVGSGTYVADSVPLGHAAAPRGSQARLAYPSTPDRVPLSQRGHDLAERFTAADLEVQPFAPGPADFSAFPVALWQRLQNKHWRQSRSDLLDYNDQGGHGSLRRAVADYLRAFRSVQLDPDQVLITTGTQQSLSLCAQLLADHGDTVWIEDPAYWGAVKAFLATGLRLQPIPVDAEGMAPDACPQATAPRLIYATPSHQYPSGAVMSLARRQQVLQLAHQHQAWVLEDDYDSEFRFSGPPLSSLQGLDHGERVLYMGTFSKVLYPGLKLGYLVVPKRLVAAFKRAHYDLNRPGQMAQQAALAEFIEMGHFASSLRRARLAYAERRQALIRALQPVLQTPPSTPATLSTAPLGWLAGAAQGLHLCMRLPTLEHTTDRRIAQQLAPHGLIARPLSAYCLARQDLQGLVLGYGYASLSQIAHHGPRLADLLQNSLNSYKKEYGVSVVARLQYHPAPCDKAPIPLLR